jgi:hypothetical protein
MSHTESCPTGLTGRQLTEFCLVWRRYYAPGGTGTGQDASVALLRQLQRVAVASNAKVIAVLVLFTDGFQAGNFPRVNNTGLDAVHALTKIAAASYPDVLIVSYNIMMVGTTSQVRTPMKLSAHCHRPDKTIF